jgi:hypothetical protein
MPDMPGVALLRHRAYRRHDDVFFERRRMYPLASLNENHRRRRSRGNVVIPKGFPRGVGSAGSRLLGFPCFPYPGISTACFLRCRLGAMFGRSRNHSASRFRYACSRERIVKKRLVRRRRNKVRSITQIAVRRVNRYAEQGYAQQPCDRTDPCCDATIHR